MNLWKSLAGMMEVELTSAEPEAALVAITGSEIEIFRVRQKGDLTLTFWLLRKDYPVLDKLCRKRGETLKLQHRSGVYWVGRQLLRRPVFLLGMIVIFSLALYLPSRILFVRVEGNGSVPARRILEAAEESGIHFGASRREVRSERVKNALLSAVPELQWAGVNTSGCVATISVRERTDPQLTKQERQVTSIVAARDGYILSGTVTRGSALFQPGQTVKKGQVLISGYTDCGICIRASSAEGEIIAQTSRNLHAVTPSVWAFREQPQEIKRKYSLLLGKKRIKIWKDSGILDTTCGRMNKEYFVTLPGGFQLPVALCVEEYTLSETLPAERSQYDAEEALREFAESYLREQMIAGKLQNRIETVTLAKGVYELQGAYVCEEMIGRVRREQIGETNGKDS